MAWQPFWNHLQLGCGGKWSAIFGELFDELLNISRLNSRGAAFDEKILRVEGTKATLEEGAKIYGEMYVSIVNFVTNIHIFHHRF